MKLALKSYSTVGTAEIDGRSYLLVTDVDPTEKRSYLLVTDVPVNEKRGEAGEYLKNEAGVVFKLVPVDK